MEDHCIITQVARDDDQVKSPCLLPAAEKVAVAKKPKSSSLLQHFLCCFRPNGAAVVQPDVLLSTSPTISTTTSSTSSATCTSEDNIVCMTTETESEPFLLDPLAFTDKRKKCAVIDLDETLVHSSFSPVSNADFIIPVEIDGTIHQVYVLKRPHVDEFLQKMGELFECILFTASLGKYADPVTDLLDKWGVFQARLFRESCVFHHGSYVKDLSRLGRELNQVIIVDNSPASYMFHPQNAVPVLSWFDDMNDCELLNLIPFCETLAKIDDVYMMLGSNNPADHMLFADVASLTNIELSADGDAVNNDVS